MESRDISRLKLRAEEILESFYGRFSVWKVTFTSFTPQNDKITICGFFFEDLAETKRHQFTMVLDRYGKLHDCKIT